ncbi:MAG TPA: PQQ-dependent sugar dehydrogenase, partial [Longimicrobiales bacterium]|nr:PQQ-dependent sugar dehydrogenase [Longimicrobiales bacterium]
GDGGDGGDPQDHGQRPETLLGSLLRLDVDGGSPYAIPTDNPFLGHASYREETWAYGLRNPWRFSVDRQTGDLYVADVGQNAACYNPSSGCSTAGLTLPVLDYQQDEGECAVTGGYVYHGSAIPDLVGRYLYADFCRPWVRSFVVSGGSVQGEQDHQDDLGPIDGIASFGEDGNGELYLVTLGGTIYELVAP